MLHNPFGRNQERRIEKMTDVELYDNARKSMESSDFKGALDFYGRLDKRFPFTRYATQGQLESIYAHYRNLENELALNAASRFIKQFPRHRAIDYVYYLRGVVYQTDIDENFFNSILGVDKSHRSPEAARNAFDAFAVLIQRFPNSRYAPDARQRMVFLRNALARYELNVAEYYLRRRAFVAASRRSQIMLRKYQGTDSIPRALAIMQESYTALGLTELAHNAQQMLNANYPNYKGEASTGWFSRQPKPAAVQAPPAGKELRLLAP